jgi:hypothetical protein
MSQARELRVQTAFRPMTAGRAEACRTISHQTVSSEIFGGTRDNQTHYPVDASHGRRKSCPDSRRGHEAEGGRCWRRKNGTRAASIGSLPCPCSSTAPRSCVCCRRRRHWRPASAPIPFDLGGDATRPHPSAGGMDEVRKGMANFVRRTSDLAREQVANPLL